MKPHLTSAVHAFSLIIISIIGYQITKSYTAFIPLVFGAVLLPLNKGIRFEDKIQSHIAVALTLLVTIALFKPFSSALADQDMGGMIRVGIMLLTGVVAFISFINSFIQARKRKRS